MSLDGIWLVLNILTSKEYNCESSNIENLLDKTIFLTALASGNRTSELAATRRDVLQRVDGGTTFQLAVKPGFLFKNQRIDRVPPNILIKPLINGDPELCPVRTLSIYLERTSTQESALFLHPSMGRPLQRPSLALRLVQLIEKADPGLFPRAHDLRKKATSLAWTRGVPPNEIINAAFWTSSNIFIFVHILACKSRLISFNL